jgi:hypothetical protein
MHRKTPRTFKRASYIALASVRTGSTGMPVEAHVVNLGFGGVAVYTRADLAGQVEVTLFHADGKGKTVTETIWGKLAWKRPVGSLMACGIEFGNLNPEDHPVTLSLMEAILK